MKCPNCGKELSETSTVCTACGAAVPSLTPEERARRRWQEREQQRREKKKQKKNKPSVSAALTPEDIFAAVAKSSHNAASQPHESVMISIEEEPTNNPMANVIQTLVKELDDDRPRTRDPLPETILHTPTAHELPAEPERSASMESTVLSASEEMSANEPERNASPESSESQTVSVQPEPMAASEPEETPASAPMPEQPPKTPESTDEKTESASVSPAEPVKPVQTHSPVIHRSLPSKPAPTVAPSPKAVFVRNEGDDFDFERVHLADTHKNTSDTPSVSEPVSQKSAASLDELTASRGQSKPSSNAIDATVPRSKPAPREPKLTDAPPTQDTVVAASVHGTSSDTAPEQTPPTHSTSEHGTMRFNVADALASMPEQTDTVIPDIRIPEAYARVRYVPQDSAQWTQEAAQDEENDWEGFDPENADWIDEDEPSHPRRLFLICVILAVMAALAVYSVATSGMI